MFSDLTFLHCAHFERCEARIDKRFDGYASLQWMAAGAVELFYDERHHDLRAEQNHGWFWPAFGGPRIRFHAAREGGVWDHRYIAFVGPRLQSWKRAGLWLETPQNAPDASAQSARFDQILALIAAPGAWNPQRAVHAIEGVLLELAQARNAPSEQALRQPEPPWLQQTREFLDSTPDFAPDYAALAHDLGLGLSTLRRRFRAATGMSLHEALLQNRLDIARRLLGETDVPIKQIAAQLGYRDVHFFSAQFKRLAGVGPAAFRRSRQN